MVASTSFGSADQKFGCLNQIAVWLSQPTRKVLQPYSLFVIFIKDSQAAYLRSNMIQRVCVQRLSPAVSLKPLDRIQFSNARFFLFFDKDYAPEKMFGPICHFGPFWVIFPIFIFFYFRFFCFSNIQNVRDFSKLIDAAFT